MKRSKAGSSSTTRERSAQLETYRKKRDPERTTEPFGGSAPSRTHPGAPVALPGPRFVVHEHWARNLHFDLRLEMDGVLKSWAVPRGPSVRAEEKRLAVHVEDHPLEYGDFEGVIPAGNYGAGSVIVWDHGWYRSFKPEPLLEQFQRGKLELELFGFKLRGRWTLVRMSRKEKEWLLLKKAGAGVSDEEMIERYPQSVVSGLTVEEMRDAGAHLETLRQTLRDMKAPQGRPAPKSVPFTFATLSEKPFSSPAWLFEIKYDGVRVLASRRDGEVELFGRNGNRNTERYPEITAALQRLRAMDFLLDGEIIAPDESGRPSFQRLQARMHVARAREAAKAAARIPVVAVFFDCLACEGHDLRRMTLEKRKQILSRVLPPLGTVRYGDHVVEQGEAFYEAASEMRLEGMVAKKLSSAYSSRRTTDWLKIKCQRRQEFVIGGYTAPQGGRTRFGALQVGLNENGKLVYVTKVGTGFDGKELERVWKLLQPLRRETSPFQERSPKGREHTWVEPKLVCEVRFTEWTREGGLRHPTYLGLREDKKPEDCVREEPVEVLRTDGSGAEDGNGDDGGEIDGDPEPSSRARASSKVAPTRAERLAAQPLKLTNLDKVFWPEEGYTKGDLIAYYDAVSEWLLPYIADRPLVLTRYPDGINGKSFFQKDAPSWTPSWIRTETIYAKDAEREIRYFIVNDVDSLRYVANMGTIPLHVWSARLGSLEQPDWMVLDLDPKKAPFAHVVRVARTLKKILDELALPSMVKTSGASGLHVLVPLGHRYTHEESRTFARLLAMLVLEEEPEISTVTRPIHAREGKVYVDYGQNGHGATIVSPYAVRPLPGAPASCPLLWEEVDSKLDPARFTIRTIPKRFAKMKDSMRGIVDMKGIEMSTAIQKIARRLEEAGE